MACAHAEEFADGGAGARADTAFLHRVVGGRCGGCLAHGDVGMHVGLADAEIEQDGAGHDGDVLAAEGVAHLAAGQVAAHAGGGFQAEGAAAGQQDAVHPIGDVAGARACRFPACRWRCRGYRRRPPRPARTEWRCSR